MKKPNYTPGKWTATPQNGTPGHCMLAQVFTDHGEELSVATMQATMNPSEASANAKFMSASKDMMEALIETYRILVELKRDSLMQQFCGMEDLVAESLEKDEELISIQKALTKAGVSGITKTE